MNNRVDSEYVVCLALMYLSVSDYVMHVSEERFLLFSTLFPPDFTFFFLLGVIL